MPKAPQIPPLLTVADLEEKIEQQKSIIQPLRKTLSAEQNEYLLSRVWLFVGLVVGGGFTIRLFTASKTTTLDLIILLPLIAIVLLFLAINTGAASRAVAKSQREVAQQQNILNNWFKEMNNRIKCKKFLALYRVRLKQIDYDIQALETLIDEGISPNEFEQTILSIVGPEEEEEIDLATRTKEAEEAKQIQVADFKAIQKHRDAILAALKERKQDIQRRVELGHLTQEEAQILLEAAQRDADQRIQALEQA